MNVLIRMTFSHASLIVHVGVQTLKQMFVQSCRDELPPKTLPQKPKQATMHTTMHAQTIHTSQRNAFTT